MRLHKEHGLNPTMPICFFCGKEKGQIALLGASYKGEAPKHMVIDYEPCDDCKKRWEQGVAILEASLTPFNPDQPPLTNQDQTIYISGAHLVVHKDAVNTDRKVVLMLQEDFKKLYEQYENSKTSNST